MEIDCASHSTCCLVASSEREILDRDCAGIDKKDPILVVSTDRDVTPLAVDGQVLVDHDCSKIDSVRQGDGLSCTGSREIDRITRSGIIDDRAQLTDSARVVVDAGDDVDGGGQSSLQPLEPRPPTWRASLLSLSSFGRVGPKPRSHVHVNLLKELIAKFSRDNNTKGQLIFTTHESNLLDQDILRQDEIWFAEKNATGETGFYPLSDYDIRSDLDIRKGYLNGRFGAIPFLANLHDLNWDKYGTEQK